MLMCKHAGFLFFAAALNAMSGCKATQTTNAPSVTESAEPAKPAVNPEMASLTSTVPLGKWGPLLQWPIVAVHMGLTPDGKVILWDRDDANDIPNKKYDSQSIYLWNPSDSTFAKYPLGTTNLFCAGATWASGGLLYVFGGHFAVNSGSAAINYFDTKTNVWNAGPTMNAGRWYATSVPLGTGEILALGGLTKSGVVNTLPQILDPKTNTLRNLPGGIFGYPMWPRGFQTSSGLVITVGPDPIARYIDPTPGPTAAKIRTAATPPFAMWRSNGTAAMYDVDKILMVGGYNGTVNTYPNVPAYATNVAMDLQIGATPDAISWKIVPPMAFRRAQAVATVLPTGEVIIVGGSQVDGTLKTNVNIVKIPEIWNPTTKVFTKMAAMIDARLYHSTAMLLPDGSVLSAGGGTPSQFGPDRKTAQIFYPPYLFAGPRPTIVSVPKTLTFNQNFDMTVTGTISQISLMRAGMVTHAFDQSQRRIPLAFTQVGNTLAVKAPLNGNYAPPGHYMLFVIGDNGVPSIAAIVNI